MKRKPLQPEPKRSCRHIYEERQALVQSLTVCMDAMQADPEFEEVDTLSLMEDAISDAIFFFTDIRRNTRDNANRHQGVECAHCDKPIEHEEDGESTYCGSMHQDCREAHNQECGACAEG